MYTLELTHIDYGTYKEIKAPTIEECFAIAKAKGYSMTTWEFYCNGIKE